MNFDSMDPTARTQAAAILANLRAQGMDGLLSDAVRLGDIKSKEEKIMYDRADLKLAYDALDAEAQLVLKRTAERIRVFAEAQRAALVDTTVPGGEAGHFMEPVQCAGCYVPGRHYPLPSSVLMTALTARAEGVVTMWVASPRPAPATLAAAYLAAAYLADADSLLAVGGVQAIDALACGVGIPVDDVIVSPGNKWITATKKLCRAFAPLTCWQARLRCWSSPTRRPR